MTELCAAVRAAKITFLSTARLHSLSSLCRELNDQRVEGDMIEAGCALGGSAVVLAAAKGTGRGLKIYDTFEMIPPPGPNDGPDVHARYETIASGEAKGFDGDVYYGYLKDIPLRVRGSFQEFGYPVEQHRVELIKGLVEDTLDVEGPVALAHIDVDWFSPVHACLERIVPRLSVGGAIVLDDYIDWSGCNKAAEEFFTPELKRQFSFSTKFGHLVIRRLRFAP